MAISGNVNNLIGGVAGIFGISMPLCSLIVETEEGKRLSIKCIKLYFHISGFVFLVWVSESNMHKQLFKVTFIYDTRIRGDRSSLYLLEELHASLPTFKCRNM